LNENVTILLEYEFCRTGQKEECSLSTCSPTDLPQPLIQSFRLRLADVLYKSPKDLPEKRKNINDLAADIRKSEVSTNPFVVDLLKDIDGQIKEALEGAAHDRWGRHFLPSLSRAHLLQQCNNFKDPGVQHYGGVLFKTVRDFADETFCALPPPKPTLPPKPAPVLVVNNPATKTSNTGSVWIKGSGIITTKAPAASTSTKKKTKASKAFDMSVYNNASGGCIWGECMAMMADGSEKKVKSIRKDDMVKTANGESARIICVTKLTLNPQDKAPLVQLDSGLVITPWHPVQMNHQWIFPCKIGKLWGSNHPEDVYNFVLDNGHIMMINNVACVTLGHGFTEEVVNHHYYGTQRVIQDLKAMNAWENGFIEMKEITARQNFVTGLVFCYLVN